MTSIAPDKVLQQAHRLHVVILSTSATIKSTPIAPLAVAAATAVLISIFTARSQDTDLALMGMRLATTALAIGVAFTLDDPAGDIKAPLPQALRYRRLTRIIYISAVWMGCLSALLWLAQSVTSAEQPPLPIPRLILEAGGQAATGLALAAALYQAHLKPGRIAGSALLMAVLILWLLPGPLRPWIHPDDPTWQAGQWIWTGVVLTSISLIIALSWDSRSNGVRRRIRPG